MDVPKLLKRLNRSESRKNMYSANSIEFTPAPAEAAHFPLVVSALNTLLRAAPDELDVTITAVLGQLGAACDAQRAYFFVRRSGSWFNTHEWCAPGVAPVQAALQGVTLKDFEEATTGLARGKAVLVKDVSSLPDNPLRDLLAMQDIRSLLCVPVLRDGVFHGFLGFDRLGEGAPFNGAEAGMLCALTDGLLSAIARQQAEQALEGMRRMQEATLERLRATLAAMPELVLEIDAGGRCIDYHCSAPELLSGEPSALLSRTLEETLPPEVARLQRAAMDEALEKGVSHPPDYMIGDQWYRLTVARVADAGKAHGFVFRIRDVTAERARENENALLIEITRRMTNHAMVLDEEGLIFWVNPAFEQRTGLKLSALRGHTFDAPLLAQGADPATIHLLLAALARREPFQTELLLRLNEGAGYWADVALQPLTGKNGSFQGSLLIGTDITERKKNEAELKRLASETAAAHTRLHEAIEALHDGFVLFDRDDRLVMCNTRYREINAGIADIIRPGVSLPEIIEAAAARDLYVAEGASVREHADALLSTVNKTDTMYWGELRYRDGQIIGVRATRMADGSHVGLRSDITAMRHAEQRLNNIIRGARVGTWELDLTTFSQEVNAYWREVLGFDAGASLTVPRSEWVSLIHPDDDRRTQALLGNVLRGETDSLEVEIRLRHRKGHWVHILTRGQVITRDATGKALKMSGVDIDISERRRAEERLSTILDAAAVGTWQLDAVTGEVVIDDQYAAMLGYQREELTPMSQALFEANVHPDDLALLQANVASLYEVGSNRTMHEFRMRHRDGHWVWILSKTRVLGWVSPGVPAAESGVHIDITENKQREFALIEAREALEKALAARRAAEKRIADIAEVTDDWFWEQDAEGRFSYVSSGFDRATGLSRARIMGKRRSEIGLAADAARSADWAELDRKIAAHEPFTDFIYRVTHDEAGAPLYVRVSGAPHFDTDGRFLGYRGVGTNVSALMAATERAEAASQAKSRFLANMSHELRTPLTGVLGMAELLGERVTDAGQRQMLETIRESGEGLLTILNDILDLAKIEAGKMAIERQPFAPDAEAQRLHLLFASRVQAKGLRLVVETAPECAQMRMGDAHRIRQILNNLISNAIKFTETGTISVSFRIAPEDMLSVEVQDTGIGMTAEQAEKVFDEFEQAEGSTARRFGGTGLGLSITRRLVHLMGGQITIDSRLGEGTRACVHLPAPAAGTAPPPAAGQDRDLSSLRVLVADDNRTNRFILNAMLTGLGVSVTLAENGQIALETYRPGAFDLLLLDISMPVLDGVSALAAIRALEAEAGAAETPALAVTAHAMQHQVQEYLASGFSGHIAKPFRRATLENALAQHAPARIVTNRNASDQPVITEAAGGATPLAVAQESSEQHIRHQRSRREEGRRGN